MDNAVARIEGGSDVTQYDPEKGLKTIATADAVEKSLQRKVKKTNDPLARQQLMVVVETKVTEQAKYIVWRDSEGPRQGRPRKDFRTEIILPDIDPGDLIAHRWRKKLCTAIEGKTVIDQPKLAASIIEAQSRCQRACEQQPKGTERGTAGTGEFLRYTPATYIEAARVVLGVIDLDPASDHQAQQTVKAEQFFTPEDDGLTRMWSGNVFLNPPYHRDLCPAFVDKLIEEMKACRIKQAILLTNNSTDTEWFRKAAEAANAICFTNGRVAFTTPAGGEVAPTQGQAFFYFGNNVQKVAEVFRKIGFGMTAVWQYAG